MSYIHFEENTYPPRPIFKKQILATVVDGMAHLQPFSVYAEYAFATKNCEAGFQIVTYRDFANAIDRLAWHLDDKLSPGEGFPTLAYIGPNDLRYAALTLACVKTGYKLLLTSPRNSTAAHLSLFGATGCQVLLHPTPRPRVVEKVLESCKLSALEIPDVEDLLSNDPLSKAYPYRKTFEEARDEPLVVLHTSGTTGLPKPITWTHDFMAAVYQWFTLAPPEGFCSDLMIPAGRRMLLTLPPFHAAGVMGAWLPVLCQATAIYPPADVIPSAQVVVDALTHTTADIAVLAPSFIEEMCKDNDIREEIVANVDSILWVGGPIPKSAGDEVSKETRLLTMIGMTEACALPTVRPHDCPSKYWQFVRFNPKAKIELRHNSGNLYEAIIVRHPDPERVQPCFKTFPDLSEWGTRDLYSPHPTESNLWLPCGRADDIIVFLNGEKTNPISMEQAVAEHPEVRAALVIGRLRPEPALLIELRTDEELSTTQRAQTIDRIWPTIAKANRDCPSHAQISESHILFTDPQRPMLRSGKGTIQRQPTLDLYAGDIDLLYWDADTVSEASGSPCIDVQDRAAVLSCVRETILDVFGELEDNADFFDSGMDSTQVLKVSRALKRSLSLSDLELSAIYKNPSVSLLTEKLNQVSAQREDPTSSLKLKAVVEKYTAIVDRVTQFASPQTSPGRGKDRVVILTGSTGSIGRYMLQILLESPSVSHIYCLNRHPNSASLQESRSKSCGLPTNFPTSKITFITSNLSKPDLGLDIDTFNKVQSATDIIHSAWNVNFNLALDAFHPHLSGIVSLITLAALSPSAPSIFFLSSVSSIAGSPITPVPEQALDDLQAPAPMGYAQSKYLAESILNHAARAMPRLDVRIARVGQVAGPVLGEGMWNRWEWVPSLVISSSNLGAIPTSLGQVDPLPIDWLPIDLLASVLVELALDSKKSEDGAAFFHPLNPHPTSWERLLPSVIEALDGAKTVTQVSYGKWLQRLKSAGGDHADLEQLARIPAIKLMDFYVNLLLQRSPPLETRKTMQASKKLQNVGEIQGEWMKKWVRAWMK